jgi:hypothetical protein
VSDLTGVAADLIGVAADLIGVTTAALQTPPVTQVSDTTNRLRLFTSVAVMTGTAALPFKQRPM